MMPNTTLPYVAGTPLFNHFMVDLETTGLTPIMHGIINFGIVPFCLRTYSRGDLTQCLNLYCDPQDKVWDDKTLNWHRSSNTAFYDDWRLLPNRLDSFELVGEIEDYIARCKLSLPPDTPIYFWAKPAHFDWPFVEQLFRDYKINNPWHYRNVIDLNSYLRGAIPYYAPQAGTKHTALGDAIDQVDTLLINLRRRQLCADMGAL